MDVDGARIECARFGEPAGGEASLVLLHEGLGCVEMWRDFPRRLHEATGRHVFAYSRQGYGRSGPRPAPWPLDYMHREGLESLPKVLRAAALDDVVLVGHSDGASIAIIYAGGIRDHAAHGLVLMAPHVFNEPLSVESIAQAAVAYRQTDLRARLERYHGPNVDDAFHGWNGAWLDPGFLEWNIEGYLPTITVPVLVLQGEKDQYGTPSQVESIAQRAGAPVSTELLPECRHAPHLDQPALVLDRISAFLGAH